MVRKLILPIATAALAVLTTACSKELKPDHKGVFVAAGGVLHELQSAVVDNEFTEEGFAIPYFYGDPPAVKEGDFYFILYGDYQVYDLKAFERKGDRWEIDTSQSDLNTTIEALGMKGEPEMQICRFTKALRRGTYVLEAQHGGVTMFYPFMVVTGY